MLQGSNSFATWWVFEEEMIMSIVQLIGSSVEWKYFDGCEVVIPSARERRMSVEMKNLCEDMARNGSTQFEFTR